LTPVGDIIFSAEVCVLCVSGLKESKNAKPPNRRDAEDAEVSQRKHTLHLQRLLPPNSEPDLDRVSTTSR